MAAGYECPSPRDWRTNENVKKKKLKRSEGTAGKVQREGRREVEWSAKSNSIHGPRH